MTRPAKSRLVEEESTATVMAGVKQVVEERGVFCACIRIGPSLRLHAQGGRAAGPAGEEVERALNQMGIELIAADGAASGCLAPGRAGASGMPAPGLEAANAFLPEWIATGHNGRFTVKAEQVGTAFLPYGGSETIWSHQEERIVGNDNTVSYHTRILQVPQQTFRFSLARCRVPVSTGWNAQPALRAPSARPLSYWSARAGERRLPEESCLMGTIDLRGDG